MEPISHQSAQIQHCLDRMAQGDERARGELLACACQRLTRLARKMLRDFPDVQRWEQTDDVRQNASLRLWRALGQVPLTDARHFFRLAALQIRRELLDLVRRYRGPEGLGAAHATHAPAVPGESRAIPHYEVAEVSHDPRRLAEWEDFHAQIDRLPDEEREAFDLIWYHGMSQEEAAVVLNVSLRTVKRRWREARLKLHKALGEDFS
jgi:RNA polymerase sigma-70 factor (ECF subfamily)